MLSNELKKGMHVQLKNGWFGVMMDNARGNIRMVEVDGYCKEIGSVYVWDIDAMCDTSPACKIELTEKQIKARNAIKAMGF